MAAFRPLRTPEFIQYSPKFPISMVNLVTSLHKSAKGRSHCLRESSLSNDHSIWAPGIASSNKCLTSSNKKLLGAKGIATRSKDATRVRIGLSFVAFRNQSRSGAHKQHDVMNPDFLDTGALWCWKRSNCAFCKEIHPRNMSNLQDSFSHLGPLNSQ